MASWITQNDTADGTNDYKTLKNVGIGTTSPASLLDLGSGENGAYVQKFLLLHSGYARSGWGHASYEDRLFCPTDGHISFGTITMDSNQTWAEKMRIENGGNVGIGVTNPGEKLEVNGKIKCGDNIVLNGHYLSGDGGNEGIYVDNDGKVGIGTTSPGSELDIIGSVGAPLPLLNVSASGDRNGISGSISGSTGYGVLGTAAGNGGAGVYGCACSSSSAMGGYFDHVNSTGPALVTGNGRVGIGISSPGSKFQINGNAAIGYSVAATAPSNGLAVSGSVGIGTTSPYDILHVEKNGGAVCIWSPNAEDQTVPLLHFRNPYTSDDWILKHAGDKFHIQTESSAGYEKITIDNYQAAGNVGIGTTSPGEKLEVNGAVKLGNKSGSANGTLYFDGTYLKLRANGTDYYVSLQTTQPY
jgi:hypothetical protein